MKDASRTMSGGAVGQRRVVLFQWQVRCRSLVWKARPGHIQVV